jgi:hypothetical protein
MAAFDFSPAQAAASMAEGRQASVSIQSLLMQIDADAVCLVRTQFQQINGRPESTHTCLSRFSCPLHDQPQSPGIEAATQLHKFESL